MAAGLVVLLAIVGYAWQATRSGQREELLRQGVRQLAEQVGGVRQRGGRYQIVKRIGQGGMGKVYEVNHIHLSRRFALKIISSQVAETDEARELFYREARFASAEAMALHYIDDLDSKMESMRALFEREDQGEMGPGALDRSFEGTYR